MEYESWNVDEIMLWIMSLENGRFNRIAGVLRKGFMEIEMTGYYLPDITRDELFKSPFDIKHFGDRRDLELHFQSLRQQNSISTANEGAVRAVTAYY
mmetsp:Transcript_137/g.209  ORF Transcript_137/g.209 Transcript_137/m.209 type:complete len:97 (+) Transcript_137:125-415(+)